MYNYKTFRSNFGLSIIQISQFLVSEVEKLLVDEVQRKRKAFFDAITVLKEINQLLIQAKRYTGNNTKTNEHRSYIKVSSKYLSEKTNLSERRIETARKLLKNVGVLKFLKPFKTGDVWHNIWVVQTDQYKGYITNVIFKTDDPKKRVRRMTKTENAQWLFIQDFERYVRTYINTDEIKELDEEYSHLLEDPKNVYNLSKSRYEIRDEINNYLFKRSKLVAKSNAKELFKKFVYYNRFLANEAGVHTSFLKNYRPEGKYFEVIKMGYCLNIDCTDEIQCSSCLNIFSSHFDEESRLEYRAEVRRELLIQARMA